MKRRKFIQNASLSTLAVMATSTVIGCESKTKEKESLVTPITHPVQPLVIATWNVPRATAKAWEVLQGRGSALDAVEQGCRVEEANVNNSSVGKGGLPDRDGRVTLDACIMDKDGNYGAVMCVQHITHVISLARKVMEETPHVIMVGEGAEQFAYAQGFKKENLLTEASKRAWEKWKEQSVYQPIINIENHDTIGMLAIDKDGDISGACTTSGLAYKMAGRVGDSPVIGSGLFIDNEVGGCTATGMGEEVLKTVASFLVVELMRQGKSPQDACEEAIKRIVEKAGDRYTAFQVGLIAVNKQGEIGAYCIHKWFNYTVYTDEKNINYPSDFYIKT